MRKFKKIPKPEIKHENTFNETIKKTEKVLLHSDTMNSINRYISKRLKKEKEESQKSNFSK
jgi:hypothetical protein